MKIVLQQILAVWSSASKVVLLLFTITACIAFYRNRLDSKDFMLLASMVFSYYFSISQPGKSDKPVLPPDVPPATEHTIQTIEETRTTSAPPPAPTVPVTSSPVPDSPPQGG